jgi:hypothetical protein
VAVDLESHVNSLIAKQLHRDLRYRCLLLQSSDLQVLSAAAEHAAQAIATGWGMKPEVIEYRQFLDEVGGWSGTMVLGYLEERVHSKPVVIVGPLHFLDFWSAQTQGVFWKYLASFSSGPGIVLTDVLRTEGVDGPFFLINRIGGIDLRYLKSRLALTESSPA